MSSEDFEITASDVSDVVATVRVRYRPATDTMVRLIGTLRGPYCERMRTLAAEFTFREVAGASGVAVAEVVDPCLWSPELPHVYHVEVEAIRGGQPIAKFCGSVGLQHTGRSTSST